jgi:hypothetical protein
MLADEIERDEPRGSREILLSRIRDLVAGSGLRCVSVASDRVPGSDV